MDWNKFFNSIWVFIKVNSIKILLFAVALIAGLIIIKLVLSAVRRIFKNNPIKKTLGSFIISSLKFILYIILVFILAAILGIPTTPLAAAIGAIGLAIGLALQSSLANLANGVVIIGTKPFLEGDHISIDEIEGIVDSIHMLTTVLITFDNKKITLPNSKVTNSSVINYSALVERRLDLNFNLAYSTDLNKARQVIEQVIDNSKYKLRKATAIRLTEFNSSSITLSTRVWINTPDYWDAYWELHEKVFLAFRENNIVIPFNQLDVKVKNLSLPPDEFFESKDTVNADIKKTKK